MRELFFYQAFGLNIISEFWIQYLKCVDVSNDNFSNIDVRITYGEVPKCIKNGVVATEYMTVSNQEMLLCIDGVADYYVKNGKDIVVDPKCEISNTKLYVFIIGSCMGAILRQRNILPLHSGCVYNGHYGILFIGQSGAGKSTMTGEFIRRGWKLVTDDIAPITIKDNNCYVQSGIPMQRLWDDSVETLGIAQGDLSTVWRNEEG